MELQTSPLDLHVTGIAYEGSIKLYSLAERAGYIPMVPRPNGDRRSPYQPAKEGKREESSSFLKKRTKKLLIMSSLSAA
jgi:hypothetical protein